MPDRDTPRAAAILVDGPADVDALLAEVTQACQAEGVRLRGLLMHREQVGQGCATEMIMVDVHTRARYPVSQPLGQGATGCRADPDGFARAGRVLHEARAEAAELVICNRFGSLEAEGGGFAEELLALMADGIPVLTAVSPRHQDAWARFTGGAPVLPAEPEAVQRWLKKIRPARS